tara:strand:+ start:79 stop:1788 length:1710 start_codon:yes stop_codon:yes gene_type:complete
MSVDISKLIKSGDVLKITKPDGTIMFIEIDTVDDYDAMDGMASQFTLNPNTHNFQYKLNWHNCYAFGNGVESNRIQDGFNKPFLTAGVKVSTIFEDYKEEHRTNGLVFSGIYNNVGAVNNLNQFIIAEKITKELNPTHGSIQKLHARDTDVIVLCEDKVLKVLANKDALFNADGNPQLISNTNVLGQAIPFVGEYGISKNPESFVSEAYRSYFADKQRGVIMRLSKDGLSPISMHGMRDYFKDNLKIASKILGSYDKKKDEYNVTLSLQGADDKTLTFNENVKGWTSFKSFLPEHGVSCSGDYYTFKNGLLYLHHDESADRNNFYGDPYETTFDVILNDGPSVVKTFHTIEYEGSQSKITANTDTNIDDSYYNLEDKDGWHVDYIISTKDKDYDNYYINEFIEKEGGWFNHIKGKNEDIGENTRFSSSNIQGAGVLLNTPEIDEDDGLGNITQLPELILQLKSINASMQVNDILYYVKSSDLSNNVSPTDIVKYGPIKNINNNNIIVDQENYVLNNPELEQGDFIMFAKNPVVNKSTVTGHYAKARFKNNSTEHAEIFAVSSEITISSK